MPSGLALSRRLWETRGRELLERLDLLDRCAVGCIGGTSQNAGLDDTASRDHAWGPNLTFFLFDEDWEAHHARLEEAVKQMPDEVDGVGWVGGGESRLSGVRAVLPFLRGLTGFEQHPQTPADWLPYLTRASFLGRAWQERLFDATQGELFHDPGGRFTALWREWTAYVPTDVQRALIARGLFRVWNASPEYNLTRIHARGDRLAYALCLARFVDEVISLAFPLSERFVPYYKWRVAHFRRLPSVPTAIREALDTIAAEPIPERQLTLAREVLQALKSWILDVYPLKLTPNTRLSDFAHHIRATIQDDSVRRHASRDW